MDARYDELKMDLEKAKRRIRRNNGSNNEELARVLTNAANKKLKRLRNHINKLAAKYPGTFTYVVSENKHKELVYLP